MGYKKITKECLNFLDYIANNNGTNGLISGKNKYEIPFVYGYDIPEKITAEIEYKGKIIENNNDYIQYLIEYYNYYSHIYDIDANILLAQAYVESNLKVWNYAQYNSTAMGLTQFLMGTIREVVLLNRYNSTPKFTESEQSKLLLNIINPNEDESYRVGGSKILDENSYDFDKYSTARKNRYNLYLNCINNPDIMIKAQFRYMKYIGSKNNLIASSTLFAYNRGSGYSGNTYADIINQVKMKKGGEYITEGVNYVEKIFGVLGDKNNEYIKNKPKGVYFGYELDLNCNNFDDINISV